MTIRNTTRHLLLCLLWAGLPLSAAEPQLEYVELRGLPLGEVLGLLSAESGLNAVASPRAAAVEVSLGLRGVTPTQLLDALAATHKLWYRRDAASGVVRVYTADEYQLGQVGVQQEITEIFTLRYPNALEAAYAVADLFGERVMLSLGADSGDDVGEDLRERFRRFDIINGRGQGLGGPQGGGGNTDLYTRDSPGRRESRSTSQRRRDESPYATPGDLRGAFITGRDLEGVSREISGEAGASQERLDRVVRSLSPIFVTLVRAQNRVLVRTRDPQAMAQISALVQSLDTGTSTLLMEVKILSVDLSDGFDSVFNFDVVGGEGGVSVLPGARTIDSALLATLVNDKLSLRLQLLEKEGRVTRLATPMLLTTNHEVSRVFVGEERPITTGFTSSSDLASPAGSVSVVAQPTQPILVPQTETRPVGTTLLLTPSINADRTVSIRILVEQSSLGTKASIPVAVTNSLNQAQIQDALVDVVNARSFSGTLVAKDRIPLAIGGLIEDSVSDRQSRVPVLGSIPLLGALFRDTSKQRSRRELIVLITPHVMMTPAEMASVSRGYLHRGSLHPYTGAPEENLDVYGNPTSEHEGYELRDGYWLY